MKFTVFAFIAGLCLVAVNASAVVPIDENDIEFLTGGDVIEIETHGAFSGLYWVCKGALKNLKRVYCVIQAANNMKNAAINFNNNIKACGGNVSQQVLAVIDGCNSVITDVNNLTGTNDNVCNNSDDSQSTSATGWKCFWSLLKNLLQLKKDIQNTLTLIQKIPTTGADANSCVTDAVNQLNNTFTSFPSHMQTCSKLTSS